MQYVGESGCQLYIRVIIDNTLYAVYDTDSHAADMQTFADTADNSHGAYMQTFIDTADNSHVAVRFLGVTEMG